ncbi:MAG: response regulator [Synechococcaceae cyanobacterium SM2_3_1]|nr:response regulator [Synechococcaceae cyanobacterium SM2_3_1]
MTTHDQLLMSPSSQSIPTTSTDLQNYSTLHTFTDLSRYLEDLSRRRVTSRVLLMGAKGLQWSLYLCLGRLVWAGEGIQPHQRWHRILHQHCPEVDHVDIEFLTQEAKGGVSEYRVLTRLLERRTIQRVQLVAIVEEVVTEVLFDVRHYLEEMQSPDRPEHRVLALMQQDQSLDTPFTLIRSEQALEKVRQTWDAWQETGLAAYSPTDAITIRRPQNLKECALPATLEILHHYLDGTQSLRSIASLLDQDLTELATLLFPEVACGNLAVVSLVSGQDHPPTQPNTPAQTLSPSSPKPHSIKPGQKPVIVCIDDSPMVAKQLELLLCPHGFKLLYEQNPLQAIPTLLKHKPTLILLDLVMPVSNGYEVCAQIHRVSRLKDIPVVILTGSDGLVDRVRAKMVGADGFLAKPVDPQKLIETVKSFVDQQ